MGEKAPYLCLRMISLTSTASSWDSYFSSYLQVVHRQSLAQAGFIGNIYTIASCTWGPIVGV